ncbi:hypothetical protein SFR_2190 [Streptomyces sp. FR-008]|nr:hypothetical protein SFR_2190 [Streptomyces sp. FR-008]
MTGRLYNVVNRAAGRPELADGTEDFGDKGLGHVREVPHGVHGARHALSPHRAKARVRPVRELPPGAPRARTGHRTGLRGHAPGGAWLPGVRTYPSPAGTPRRTAYDRTARTSCRPPPRGARHAHRPYRRTTPYPEPRPPSSCPGPRPVRLSRPALSARPTTVPADRPPRSVRA